MSPIVDFSLTNAAMLALPNGLMAHVNRDFALGTYPYYNVLPDGLNSPFIIRYSPFAIQ
jgi:hypothetical protein